MSRARVRAALRGAVSVSLNVHGVARELQEVKRHELWGRFSYGRYGRNVGHARIFDLLARHGIAATVFVPAADAAADPALVRRVIADGHELAAHGRAFEDHAALGEAELAVLEEAHATLTRIAGAPPSGWRAPHGKLSSRTLWLLASLGYRYDSSFQDDDYPYALEADGGVGMIEVPQNEMLIDATLWAQRATHERVLKSWIEEFDALHAEGCYACLTLHARADYGSGRASRIAVVDAFLNHVRATPGTRFVTCGEAARLATEALRAA
jgi:peptidoglycan/xylan/chitin deacetylase (PgdA/CDA1 family)